MYLRTSHIRTADIIINIHLNTYYNYAGLHFIVYCLSSYVGTLYGMPADLYFIFSSTHRLTDFVCLCMLVYQPNLVINHCDILDVCLLTGDDRYIQLS